MRRLALTLLLCGAAETAQAEGGYSAPTNYVLRCSGCHGIEGHGAVSGGVPALAGSVGHIASTDRGRTYMMHVPGLLAANLTDAEIAGVMNYVLGRWAGAATVKPFTAREVSARRAIPVGDVVAYRRGVVAELSAAGITVADYPWP